MLSEDKIRVMTRLAVFEKEHGKENEVASRFYKNDYISYHMIWAGIMTTIAYGFGLLLFFLLNFDKYMGQMHTMDLVKQGKMMALIYVCVLVVMLTISWFVYKKRYAEAQKYLNQYCDELRELEKIYNKELKREHMRLKQEGKK